ncbi:uncharacterized protein LOC119275379 isoform X1 [Triticum dicoccoides]|uniref:uncharacterized protein LOC119275379 isoform X1 n=1 Tax=Triticum dicoccoides TaxID=85692 RepID=UPI0018904D9B|nr:uncharacterized protein LOC119275379 isoform X1 [Triticum dicoccoides]
MPSSRAPPQQLGRWKSFDAGRRHQQPELLRCIAGGGIVAKQRPLRGAMVSTTTAAGETGGAAGDTKRRSLTNAGAATHQRVDGRHTRATAGELQWSARRRRRSCNGDARRRRGAAMERLTPTAELLDAGGGAALERSTQAAELQWGCKSSATELQWSASGPGAASLRLRLAWCSVAGASLGGAHCSEALLPRLGSTVLP